MHSFTQREAKSAQLKKHGVKAIVENEEGLCGGARNPLKLKRKSRHHRNFFLINLQNKTFYFENYF